MRLRWVCLLYFVLCWLCVASLVVPLVVVSETITLEEAVTFVLEFLPVVAAATLLQTLPWSRGRRW